MQTQVQEATGERDSGDPGVRPVGDELVSGLVRRVRRMAKLSQRELAHELGVSQSAVAKWETGRTSPTVLMLTRVLAVVELGLAAVRSGADRGDQRRDDELVLPMKVVAARDAAGRRYPAHAFVRAEGWWAPEGSEMTPWYGPILSRSEDLELPRVRYSRWRPRDHPSTLADVDDHPTWPELVAQAREGWRPPRRHVFAIPEWALADTRRSRNRRPDEFRALARTVSLAPSRSRGQPLVPRSRRE